jgi:DNA repair protein RadC
VDVSELLDNLRLEDREHFVCVFVNANNGVLGVETVSVGTVTASLVHPREVFKSAILLNACGVILVHNHPSGEVAPSSEDIAATHRMADAGKLMGIPVLDHVIIAGKNYASLRERGLIS